MKLTEKALRAAKLREKHGGVSDNVFGGAIARKRTLYWIGFLRGALASGRIEAGEPSAISAEAKKFHEFFSDHDANDLAMDIDAGCFESDAGLQETLEAIVRSKTLEVLETGEAKEVDLINLFLGKCAGVVCDGLVLRREAELLDRFFWESVTIQECLPLRGIQEALTSALSAPSYGETEAEQLREQIARIVGDGYLDTGIEAIGSVPFMKGAIHDPQALQIKEKKFVLTGELRFADRPTIALQLETLGSTLMQAVSGKTDYVVVADSASRQWRTTHFGTKIEKAIRLISEGAHIQFVTERAFTSAFQAALLKNK